MAEYTGSFNSNIGQIHWYGTIHEDVFNIELNNINPNNDRPRHDSHHVYGYGGGDYYKFSGFDILQNHTTGRLDTFNPTQDILQINGTELSLGELGQHNGYKITIDDVTCSVVDHLGQQWLRMEVGNSKAALFALEGFRIVSGTMEPHFRNDLSLNEVQDMHATAYENPFNFVPFEIYDSWTLVGASPNPNSFVSGTSSGDFIFSPTAGGDQSIHGRDGNDVLQGANGNDTIYGDGGDDAIAGGVDDDVLLGGSGVDSLYGGTGNDVLEGESGDDSLFGNAGADSMEGGNGDDILVGGEGNDFLDGQYDNDSLSGGNGADTLSGGHGNDILTAGAMGDVILGGSGDDFLNGGSGHDQLIGGSGTDRFYHAGTFGHGSDWIKDYVSAEGDVLVFGGNASAADFQVNFDETSNSGAHGVDEAFVIHRPTGQILWALVDGAAQSEIVLELNSIEYDLLG